MLSTAAFFLGLDDKIMINQRVRKAYDSEGRGANSLNFKYSTLP